MAWATVRTGSPWPKTTRERDSSRVRSRSFSETVACFSGMRAIRATTRSISGTSTLAPGPVEARRNAAPASSIRSTALSGRRCSRRWRRASFTADSRAASVYVTAWCAS